MTLPANTANNRRWPALGDLRHQISVLAPIPAPDGSGGSATAYALQAQVFADIRTSSGQAKLFDDRLAGDLSLSVWIRFIPGLTPDHRFQFGTRTFLIRSVIDHDGRNRFLECLCEEFVT